MYFLKYQDQQLPVWIDFFVVKTVCGKLNISLAEFDNVNSDVNNIEVVVYEALKRGHTLQGKSFNYPEFTVTDILSEGNNLGYFLYVVFVNCVVAMTTPTIKKEEDNDTDKKK